MMYYLEHSNACLRASADEGLPIGSVNWLNLPGILRSLLVAQNDMK